jgi:hypothetical protein
LVGATLAVLVVLLVVLIGMTHDHFENRRRLVLAGATAIDTTCLRAGYLAEPDRTAVRQLLRDSVAARCGSGCLRCRAGDEARPFAQAIPDRVPRPGEPVPVLLA